MSEAFNFIKKEVYNTGVILWILLSFQEHFFIEYLRATASE